MDTPTLVTLPVEIALLIAEQLPSCRDVLSLMRVYLVSKVKSQDTIRRFQRILFQIDAQRLRQIPNWSLPDSDDLPFGLTWAILQGNIGLTYLALAQYKTSLGPWFHVGSHRRLEICLRYSGSRLSLELPPPRNTSQKDRFKLLPEYKITCLIDRFHSNLSEFNLGSSALRVPPAPSTDNTPRDDELELRHPTPAMLAALSGSTDMLKQVVLEEWPTLLDKHKTFRGYVHMPIDEVRCGLSALSLAAMRGHLEMVQLLVGSGAAVHWMREGNKEHLLSLAEGHRWKPDSGILASVCDLGLDLQISEEQQSARGDILRYFLDMGYPVNQKASLSWLVWKGCFHIEYARQLTFTPLWYTIWALKAEHVPHAQLLIRRGASWAPWTAWAEAPWRGEGRHWWTPGCPDASISPLEFVLRGGGGCLLHRCDKRRRKPNAARLKTEQTLFMTMMEEGTERPTTRDQLRLVLELVIEGHSQRPLKGHPRLRDLCRTRVRYLVEKGARIEDLDEQFVKELRKLGKSWVEALCQ